MAVLSLICNIFSPQIVSLFRDDEQVLETGVPALRILCGALIFLPTVMVSNMTFQGVGKTGRAFFLACAQNGLYFIPLILILPRLWGVNGIIISQPAGYFLASLTAAPFLINFIKYLSCEQKKTESTN